MVKKIVSSAKKLLIEEAVSDIIDIYEGWDAGCVITSELDDTLKDYGGYANKDAIVSLYYKYSHALDADDTWNKIAKDLAKMLKGKDGRKKGKKSRNQEKVDRAKLEAEVIETLKGLTDEKLEFISKNLKKCV